MNTYEVLSNGTSIVTGAVAIANIHEILSIIILVLSIANILINMIIRIYHKIKNKKYDEIPNEIDTTIEQLEQLEKKEDD